MPRRRKAPQISPSRLTLLTKSTIPPTPIILGKGTFGTVYSGILDSVHPIALKTTNTNPQLPTLPLTVQSAQDAHARHEAEAKRQIQREELALRAARRSPGVVRLYGTCYGGLVLERLHQRELPTQTICRVRFCAEVATALSGLHRLGVSHGDMKLGNVMFSNGVKLVDFGLACVDGCVEETIGRGTGAYLAPEGWGRVEGVAQRIKLDVYALGMLIYEVFCGQPWKDVEGVARRVLNGERPIWRGDDDAVRRVVETCWRQEPDDRPTAEWVADTLRGIERDLVGQIGPIGPICGFETREVFGKEDSQKLPVSDVDAISSDNMDEPDVQVSPRSVNPYLPPPSPGIPVQPSSDTVNGPPPEPSPQHQAPEEDVVQVVPEAEPESSEDPDVAAAVREVDDIDPDLERRPSSSGYAPEREGTSTSNTTSTTTPSPPQQVDYPFKKQIEDNDLRSLIHVLNNSRQDPHQATLALEAITVLLVTPPNPELFSSSLPTLSVLTSRNTTARLAKATCLVIHRLATNPTPTTEKALRISAAYDILATSLRRHPTELPVVLTATTAMHALASASTSQCAILVDQGAPAAALRALARATRTFKKDIPIASASLQVLGVMSRQHGPRLVKDGAVEAIMSAMASFAHPQIDRLALPTLMTLCAEDEGRRRGVNGVGAIAGAVTRSEDTRTLHQTYVLLAELAKQTALATNAFSGSTVVEAVLGTLEDNVEGDEKLIEAGFACLAGMSTLGGDICGTLEIMQVFDLVYNLVNARPRHRGTALGAAVFLREILKELRNASHTINLDLPYSMLVQLQERWSKDSVILGHCRTAIRMVREATGRSNAREHEPKSSLKLFVKKFSTRKNNSLKAEGSAG